MDLIPKFTSADIESLRQLAHQRRSETIENQLVDSELILNPKRDQRVDYPTLFWHVQSSNFAVIRNGTDRF